MALSGVIGQTYAKSRLGMLFLGEPGHAYVFSGPVGIGKKRLAHEVACGLLCEQPGDDGACGECHNCLYFREGSHPDFREISLGDGDKNIKVSEIRSRICGDVSIYPQISARKVYMIEGDALNEEGQNALLKTLEEPPPYAVFLITVTDTSKLLQTILSRSAIIPLHPNTEAELLEILKLELAISGDEALFFARYAKGIPGQALSLAKDRNFSELRNETLDMILSIPSRTRTDLLTQGYSFFEAEKDRIDEILMMIQLLLRDFAFLIRYPDGNSLLNVDKRDKITHILSHSQIQMEQINRASLAVNRAVRALSANCTFESTICQMLLSLHKELIHA
jgi:DNA polymerase-3 subunit delta'